jgi:hypothetical protein
MFMFLGLSIYGPGKNRIQALIKIYSTNYYYNFFPVFAILAKLRFLIVTNLF